MPPEIAAVRRCCTRNPVFGRVFYNSDFSTERRTINLVNVVSRPHDRPFEPMLFDQVSNLIRFLPSELVPIEKNIGELSEPDISFENGSLKPSFTKQMKDKK